jgi:hypothetical protein
MISHIYRHCVSSATMAALALLVVRAVCILARAEEPYALWATTASGLGTPGRMAASPAGDLYLLKGSGSSGALLKFDPKGRLVSSNAFSSLPGQFTHVNDIKLSSLGHMHLTGRGGANGTNAFAVAKLNAAGELAWVSRESTLLTNSPNYALVSAPDSQGNLWVVGDSRGGISLGTFALGEGTGLLLCRYSTEGQVLSVHRIDYQGVDANSSVYVYDFELDAAGNLFLSGFLYGGITNFGGTAVYPSNQRGDGYIAKFNSAGGFEWVRLAQVQGTIGMSMAVDRQGNTYFLESSMRLGKLDSNGQLLWAKQFSGSWLSLFPQGITVDATEHPVFTGEIDGTAWFDAIGLTAQTSSYTDFFIARADADGNIQWAMRGGGAEYDRGDRVVCDASGNIFLGAEIRKSVGNFDGLALTPANAGTGSTTITLAKISPTPPVKIMSASGAANVSWPAKSTNYVLEAFTSLTAVSWNAVTNTPTVTATERSVQLPLTGNAKFFRLREP